MTRLCIVGVGSSFGADRLGWDVIDALALRGSRFPAEEVLLRCCAPFELFPLLANSDAAIVVDAALGDDDDHAGGWLRLDAAALASRYALSSHGFGIAQAVAVLQAVRRLPSPLLLYGIPVKAPAAPTVPPLPDGLIDEIMQRAAFILSGGRR